MCGATLCNTASHEPPAFPGKATWHLGQPPHLPTLKLSTASSTTNFTTKMSKVAVLMDRRDYEVVLRMGPRADAEPEPAPNAAAEGSRSQRSSRARFQHYQ